MVDGEAVHQRDNLMTIITYVYAYHNLHVLCL